MISPKGYRGACRKGCGRQTRREDGVCAYCLRGERRPVPDVATMTDAEILALWDAIDREIKARAQRLLTAIRARRGDSAAPTLAVVSDAAPSRVGHGE